MELYEFYVLLDNLSSILYSSACSTQYVTALTPYSLGKTVCTVGIRILTLLQTRSDSLLVRIGVTFLCRKV